ncbi:cupin domain-containing protein, partial [Pseudomonas soli]|uniref:cupin domain-containing protein n=1 Tax=Pseudomonas soli TaxID=1306993 RepID=UPI00299EB737
SFEYRHLHPYDLEVLGCASGRARVTLGGAGGQTLTVKAGNVLVLPAGTGHCCVEHSDDFLVVGAYPLGQEQYAIQRPEDGAHDQALARIAAVPRPAQDPVTGARGALITLWR